MSRAGHVYATGSLLAGKLTLQAPEALPAGHYTLKLTTGTGRHTHTTLESLTIAVTEDRTLTIN